MRLKLLGCEILLRELSHAVARSPHCVDVEYLEKGLHGMGAEKMRARIQERVDASEASHYDAIALGYALCGNGLAGIRARATPLVLPRAHDCIALLMGSRQRYQDFFDAKPGVYFRSTGWVERGRDLSQLDYIGQSRESFINRYGEDNGTYLYEQLHGYQKAYRSLIYIATGLETTARFEQAAAAEAAEKGWDFGVMKGSLAWFEALLSGDWDNERFLVVPPGSEICPSFADDVVNTNDRT